MYYCILLTTIHDLQLFKHIYTICDVFYTTFCEACVALALIIGDQE